MTDGAVGDYCEQGSLQDYYGWTCGVLRESVTARLPVTTSTVSQLAELSGGYLARLQGSLLSVSLVDSLKPLRSVSAPLVGRSGFP